MSYWINTEWVDPEYQEMKYENYKLLFKELKKPPMRILDIGCGFAWESRIFSREFGSELWLVDGDSKNNNAKPSNSKDVDYHASSDTFMFYHPLSLLEEEFKNSNLTNYNLIDCNNIKIPENIKFDLVVSWLSCGFHYPVNTYRDLILNHSDRNTRIFLDIRTHVKTGEPYLDSGVEIVKILSQRKKVINAEVRLV